LVVKSSLLKKAVQAVFLAAQKLAKTALGCTEIGEKRAGLH
jgi:hypothetical protein